VLGNETNKESAFWSLAKPFPKCQVLYKWSLITTKYHNKESLVLKCSKLFSHEILVFDVFSSPRKSEIKLTFRISFPFFVLYVCFLFKSNLMISLSLSLTPAFIDLHAIKGNAARSNLSVVRLFVWMAFAFHDFTFYCSIDSSRFASKELIIKQSVFVRSSRVVLLASTLH